METKKRTKKKKSKQCNVNHLLPPTSRHISSQYLSNGYLGGHTLFLLLLLRMIPDMVRNPFGQFQSAVLAASPQLLAHL